MVQGQAGSDCAKAISVSPRCTSTLLSNLSPASETIFSSLSLLSDREELANVINQVPFHFSIDAKGPKSQLSLPEGKSTRQDLAGLRASP